MVMVRQMPLKTSLLAIVTIRGKSFSLVTIRPLRRPIMKPRKIPQMTTMSICTMPKTPPVLSRIFWVSRKEVVETIAIS